MIQWNKIFRWTPLFNRWAQRSFLCISMLVALFSICSVMRLNATEVASWVQALGSIGAILIAVAVPAIQHKTGEKVQGLQKIRAARTRLDICIGICEGVKHCLYQWAYLRVSKPKLCIERRIRDIEHIQLWARACDSIQLAEMPSAQSVVYVIRVQDLICEVLAMLQDKENAPMAEDSIHHSGLLGDTKCHQLWSQLNAEVDHFQYEIELLSDPTKPCPWSDMIGSMIVSADRIIPGQEFMPPSHRY